MYLGFDSSTQSFSLLAIDDRQGRIVAETSVNFDEHWAANYGIEDGAKKLADGSVVGYPAVWAAALEMALEQIKSQIDLAKVQAISGSGQQHGTVYLNARAEQGLANFDVALSLEKQVKPLLSRETSPIWQDDTTTAQLNEIVEAVGRENFFQLTGNAPFERFSGPQIRKVFQQTPEVYGATAAVCLVSSFIPSLLAGRVTPWDAGDASGTHLLNIETRQFDNSLLNATAPGLAEKLLPPAAAGTVVGTISDFFVRKFGFSPQCRIIAASGDNPCSLVGLGLVQPGLSALSLGTSDTFFACTEKPRRFAAGATFASPDGRNYMSLVCRRNGSLAREKVRDWAKLGGGNDWSAFEQALNSTPAGNHGGMMIAYFEPEIVPKTSGSIVALRNLDPQNAAALARGVIEGQALAMKIHTSYMQPAGAIRITGGASVNRPLVKIIADVFNLPVLCLETPNSAALGGALMAAHGDRTAGGESVDWLQLAAPFNKIVLEQKPDQAAAAVYAELLPRFAQFEKNCTS